MADNIGRIQARRTPKGQERYELDFRKECRRLRIPERIGRINSIPSEAGPIVLESHKMAERALEAIRVRIAAGEPLNAVLDSFRPTGAYHVNRCAERWLAHQRERAASGQVARTTLRKYDWHVERHIAPRWAGTTVHDLTYGALEDWMLELRSSGLSESTVRSVLATMRTMLRWLKRRQEIREIPDFPTVAVPEREPALLTMEQQTAVLEAIPAAIRGIFLAMADLWLRPNEARALAPSDYQLVKDRGPGDPAGWMTIQRAAQDHHADVTPRKWTKTRSIRKLPVSDRLAEWLADHRSAETRLKKRFLFHSPWGDGKAMWSHAGLVNVWKRACGQAGVPPVPMREGTRHSGATAARERLGDEQMPVFQRMLGHTDVKTTEKYSRHKPKALVRLVQGK
jgi:integrase